MSNVTATIQQSLAYCIVTDYIYAGDGAKCYRGRVFPFHTYLCCAWYASSLPDNVVIQGKILCELLMEPCGKPLTDRYRWQHCSWQS